ncbi:hypothetical protein CORC01_06727 [Colletotrichum orchidophilum]|uniref:Uncharacterized protein n=1 Tax=Colletotrichum orchidophilum TaxID=1209926 RepID=A0A1G4B9I0_9PEZI|nr:uncharacterized protein CORC01_06727 [Colletotrichum orchidophilum]OHE98058.1 hypothetical protein CORC01_06727 [Colletotrichum orchidophilum]
MASYLAGVAGGSCRSFALELCLLVGCSRLLLLFDWSPLRFFPKAINLNHRRGPGPAPVSLPQLSLLPSQTRQRFDVEPRRAHTDDTWPSESQSTSLYTVP